MTSAYTVYTFYLAAADLQGQPHTVTIAAVNVRNIHNPRTLKDDQKIVLTFVKRNKVLALNKTQAEQMMAVTGTDVIEKWRDRQIVLLPARTRGKDTITIAAPGATAAAATTPTMQHEDEEEF